MKLNRKKYFAPKEQKELITCSENSLLNNTLFYKICCKFFEYSKRRFEVSKGHDRPFSDDEFSKQVLIIFLPKRLKTFKIRERFCNASRICPLGKAQ
jgi:hypothetical protein